MLSILFSTALLLPSDTIELPPVIHEVPSRTVNGEQVDEFSGSVLSELLTASGSVAKNVGNQIPIPVLDSGRPGGNSQIRGLGKSAEELSVQTLGVSLNPAQGGGFDFSMLPSFLWADFQFSTSSAGGRIQLTPWTALQMKESKTAGQRYGMQFGSQGDFQALAGASIPLKSSLLVGINSGNLNGISGSWSGKHIISPRNTLHAHLLATDHRAQMPGTVSFPTTRAHQRGKRWIPILNHNWTLNPQATLDSTAYWDGSELEFQDPDYGMSSRDFTRRFGMSQEYRWKNLTLNGTFDHLQYYQTGFRPPDENHGRLGIQQKIIIRDRPTSILSISPHLELVHATSMESYPVANVMMHHDYYFDYNRKTNSFFQMSFSRRLPSLVDRYYNLPWYQGNPQLKPESVVTFSTGTKIHAKKLELSFQLQNQLRWATQVQTMRSVEGKENFHSSTSNYKILTMENRGKASVLSLIQQLKMPIASSLEINESTLISHSRIFHNNSEFPLLPRFTQLIGLTYRPITIAHGLQITTLLRAISSSASGVMSKRIAGSASMDASIQYSWHGQNERINTILYIENCLDRPIIWMEDMFPKRRSVVLSFSYLL